MAKLITKRDRNLLSRSDVTKGYPILNQFLDETPNLDSKELNILGEDAVKFFNDIYPKINKEAVNEWVVDKDYVDYRPGEGIKCQLCGTPIIYICAIQNKINNRSMIIGKECVLHFGINSDFNMEEVLAEKKRINRLEKLNNFFPGIEKKIDRWDAFIDEQEILIKKDVKAKYIELGLNAKNIFNEFLSEKATNRIRNKLLVEMNQILSSQIKEVDKIKNFVKKTKSDTLIPDRSLIKRLSTSGQRNVIDMLEEDGKIRHRTLFKINDEVYSISLINTLNSKFSTIECQIKEVVNVGNEWGYRFTYRKKANIKLFCSHKDLFFNYYNFITGDEGDDIDLKGLISISKFYDWESIEAGLYDHFTLIKEYGLELKEVYYDYGDMYVLDKKQNLFYKLDIKKTSQEFFMDYFFKNLSTKQKLYDYVKRNVKNSISKKDMIHLKKERYDAYDKLSQGGFI